MTDNSKKGKGEAPKHRINADFDTAMRKLITTPRQQPPVKRTQNPRSK